MEQDQLDECRIAAALYSIGALPDEEKQQFEQRLAGGCPFCTSQLHEYASVAKELALSVPLEQPDPSLRRRLLDRLETVPMNVQARADITLVRADETSWTSLPIPGVEIRPLLGEKTLLVRMQPGSSYPAHEHRYDEQCYVLEGSVVDSFGVTAHAGDFVCMPAGSTHQPIHTDTGCVFLIAYTP
ncbi:MAG: cupin domain-containing protein [Acidobacteriaceae bacterium]|nr:cupin domain-containing protein [Acidobacteriaceae bacterium]